MALGFKNIKKVLPPHLVVNSIYAYSVMNQPDIVI